MNKPLPYLLAIAIAYHAAPAAQAAQVTIEPAQDASIFQSPANNGSGGGNGLFAGNNGNSSPRRALLAFDVAGGLPANAVVQSVQLQLTLGMAAGSAVDRIVGLHRLSANWGEAATQAGLDPNSMSNQGQGAAALTGDVTWNSQFHNTMPAQPWTNAGGVFAAAPSASTPVGASADVAYTWGSTSAMVSDVQDWLQNPAANFGWLLRGDESTATTVRGFYSRNVQTAGNRPKLTISYVVPEPASLLLSVLASATIAVRRRS